MFNPITLECDFPENVVCLTKSGKCKQFHDRTMPITKRKGNKLSKFKNINIKKNIKQFTYKKYYKIAFPDSVIMLEG